MIGVQIILCIGMMLPNHSVQTTFINQHINENRVQAKSYKFSDYIHFDWNTATDRVKMNECVCDCSLRGNENGKK